MRQRRVKNLEAKYEKYEDILIREPAEMRGRWLERSKGRPVYVEIGCGKGKFISELAAREPDHFFVAIEGNMSVMLRAMEKIRDKDLHNVVFTPEFAEDLSDWFDFAEVQGIYLNFSDPLPKNYWYRRRLTYRNRLRSYFRVLADDGVVTFKTDNTGLFEWTLLEIEAADLKVKELTRDLHAEVMSIADPEERSAFNIETEYEAKFSGLGEKIKRVVIGRTDREDRNMNTSIAAYNGRNIPVNFTDINTSLSPDEKLAADISASLFGSYKPRSFSEIILTPGIVESVRMMVANYSCPADRILMSAAHNCVFDRIAEDMGRSVECFALTGEDGLFSAEDIEYRIGKLLRNQEHLLVILDAEACAADNNISLADTMKAICRTLNETDLGKKISFMTVISGEESAKLFGEEGLAPADNLRSNILPAIASSITNDNTCGCQSYVICLAHNPETAGEFMRVSAYSASASWTLI